MVIVSSPHAVDRVVGSTAVNASPAPPPVMVRAFVAGSIYRQDLCRVVGVVDLPVTIRIDRRHERRSVDGQRGSVSASGD